MLPEFVVMNGERSGMMVRMQQVTFQSTLREAAAALRRACSASADEGVQMLLDDGMTTALGLGRDEEEAAAKCHTPLVDYSSAVGEAIPVYFVHVTAVEVTSSEGATRPFRFNAPSHCTGSQVLALLHDHRLLPSTAATCFLNGRAVSPRNDWAVADLFLQPRFSVSVKTLHGQTFTFQVEASDSVLALKQKVFHQAGVPMDDQRLIIKGRQMEDHNSLHTYDFKSGNVVHLVTRLRGG